MNCLTLIFSKNRALQLDATLKSFLLHCKDLESTQVRVLYVASTPLHAEQYLQLARDYRQYRRLQFVHEKNFRQDVLAILSPFDYVLFLVDDNIFVKGFSLLEVCDDIQKETDSIGFSLRLGKNTTYCYPVDKKQRLPRFKIMGKKVLRYQWANAQYDFGYPLEVSSSVYRTEDILPFIAMLPFKNPNSLEQLMNLYNAAFTTLRRFLLCYEQSITFCAPVNMVQTYWSNRASNRAEYRHDSLANLFSRGYRIDVSAYRDLIPNACHQEIDLTFVAPPKLPQVDKPKVSVIIPCYNHAQFLSEAVDSVVNQTFEDWECLIVNDGSPDNTNEVAHTLIAKYPDKRITLLEKENGGLADARNFGIRHSSGEYILPLDADDKIHPEMLQKSVVLLDARPELAIAYTHLQRFNNETGALEIVNFRDYEPGEICIFNCYSYCSLYHREAWEAVGGYSTNMIWGYEDWDFWVGCIEKGFYAKRIPEPLLLYRLKSSSMVTEAVKHDAELKARIVLNHPRLFTDLQIKWAKGMMNNEPWTRAVQNIRGTIPDLEDLVDPTTPIEIMAFIRQADRHIEKNDRPSACEVIKQALLMIDKNAPMRGILCNILSSLGDPRAADEFRKG
jgi:glycosyltransferase involved in cell wall biosynthesis